MTHMPQYRRKKLKIHHILRRCLLWVMVADIVIIVHFYVSIRLCSSAQTIVISYFSIYAKLWIWTGSSRALSYQVIHLPARPPLSFVSSTLISPTSCKRYVKKIRSSNIYNGNLGETWKCNLPQTNLVHRDWPKLTTPILNKRVKQKVLSHLSDWAQFR